MALKMINTESDPIATIADRAMLVSLNLSVWQARRTDKGITDKVASEHHVTAKVGKYSKSLLPNCPAYDKVKTLAGEMRTSFYHFTLPWLQDGSRILLAAGYLKFSAVMKAHREKFDEAVSAFVAEYPLYVEQAKLDLNGLFNETDYPNVVKLSRSFEAGLKVLPLPSAHDFRVDLSADAVSVIRAGIEQGVKDACIDASRDAWNRLEAALSAMSERLRDEKGIYRDSLFSNLAELVDVLPALNVMDDPKLDAIAAKAKADVLSFTPQQCRDDKTARSEAAAKVDALLRLVGGSN